MTLEAHQKAESVILHELAGLLSGLWTVAELVENRPDHPEREVFISMLREESKKAARTFKDLQLIRGLMKNSVAERVEPTPVSEIIEPALSLAEVVPEVASSSSSLERFVVIADGVALADFVARFVDLSNELGSSPVIDVKMVARGIELRVSCGPRESYDELMQGFKRGDGRGRALFLLDRIVTRWGAEDWIERSGDRVFVVVQLASADA